MVDWYVNAPQGLSYGAGTPRDISQMVMRGLSAMPESFYQGAMRQPVIDPATRQPIDPTAPDAWKKVMAAGAQRGGLQYLQGVMPYMMWPEVSKIAGERPPIPAEGTPEETPETPKTPGPGAAVKTTGPTLASLGAFYTREGIRTPEEIERIKADLIEKGGIPAKGTLTKDQIELVASRMSGAGASLSPSAYNPIGASPRNIAYQRTASAAPGAFGPSEGETAPGAAAPADARDTGASGSPGVMPSRAPAETATPALASAGIRPNAPPTPAGPGGQPIPPEVARAYAQAGPAAAPPRPPPPPPRPDMAEITPQQSMQAANNWARYEQQMSVLASRWASVPGGMGAGIAAQFKDAADQAGKVSEQYRKFGLGQQEKSPEERAAARLGKTVPEYQGEQEAAKKLGEAVGKRIGEAVEAGGSAARSAISTLNVMEDAIRAGGRNVSFGPGAEGWLQFKEAVNNVFPGLFKGVAESEVIKKLNAKLASESAKAMTARPSQLEFKAFMANNPGLATSARGTLMLIDILRQSQGQAIKLGAMAMGASPRTWGKDEEAFYNDPKNDIVGPWRRTLINKDTGHVMVRNRDNTQWVDAPSLPGGGQWRPPVLPQ